MNEQKESFSGYQSKKEAKKTEETENKEKENLKEMPPEAKVIHTFSITSPDKIVSLPLYELPVVDGEGKIQYIIYLLGWPKDMISGPLKDLAETTPYLGRANDFEDDSYYFYQIDVRGPQQKFSKELIKKRVKLQFEQLKRAFYFIKKSTRE